VDSINGDDSLGGLGNGIAFKTIQAAIDVIVTQHASVYGTLPPSPPSTVVPPPPHNARNGYVISIAPFTSYDEDLTIDVSGALHLMITGQAGWDLGLFDGSTTNWQPQGAPSTITGPGVSSRSITITGNPYVNTSGAPNNDIRASVIITSYSAAPWHGTNHLAWYGPRIAGRILFDLPNQAGAPVAYGGNVEAVLDCEIHGNGFTESVSCINTTYASVAPGNNPLLTLECNRARFRKAANFGSSCTLGQAINSRFSGLLTTGTYGTIHLCDFAAGWTATNTAAFFPTGVFSSRMLGTFTGNGGAFLRMDLATNTTFVDNGCTLVGWAKQLLNNAT
jgi:hypothetical protein